jgi:hypothetical protein
MVWPVEYASRRIGGVPRVPGVIGGSGRYYWTIAQAIAGEAALFAFDAVNTAAAGTTTGSVKGPNTLSAVNDFYKDWFLVDQDGVPSSPILGRAWARVSDYVGATRVLTLDKQLPFVPGDTFFLVKPVRVMLAEDIEEDLALNGTALELELCGHKLIGKIDISDSEFYFFRGAGYITGGVQVTAGDPTIILEKLRISRREGQAFAVDITPTALFNATFLDCELNGIFSFVGGAKTVIEAVRTDFAGGSASKCIVPTGVRPAIYRLWDCEFPGGLYTDLKPERIKVWDELPALAALVQGQPLTINAAGQAKVCVAADIVEGSALDSASGIGVPIILVREGEVFLKVNASVVAGDNIGLDLATPTQYVKVAAIPFQNGGRALEAAGATLAGLAYSSVMQR